ncbi:MAG TPA: SDR family oxidoreductase [Anaerolineaceae bacterium]|nr:SDR family oxidoreductase [Anaerolineaceae bacterium]
MNRSFENKSTLITGGSSGIGLALAKQLAASGANVCIVARDAKRLDDACRQVADCRISEKQTIDTLQADVTNPNTLIPLLKKHMRVRGVPDLLINCASAAQPGEFDQQDIDVFRWMMDVNYLGTVYAIKGIVSEMIARGSGHIVNFSSIVGLVGLYGYSAYGASKFAVHGFSDVLRQELKSTGVRVSIVFPSDTQTPQLEYEERFKPPITKVIAGATQGKILSADAVAAAVLKGIARGRYVILPSADSIWMYRAVRLVGDLAYPILDWLVHWAQRKIDRLKDGQRQENKTDPDKVSGQQVNELHPDGSQQDHVDHP